MRLDIPKSWRLLESTLNQINPTAAQLFNYFLDLAGKAQDEKYDLRAELLRQPGRRHHQLWEKSCQHYAGRSAGGAGNLPHRLPQPGEAGRGHQRRPRPAVPARQHQGPRISGAQNLLGDLAASLRKAAAGPIILPPAAATSPSPATWKCWRNFCAATTATNRVMSQTPGLVDAAQKAGGGMSAGIFSFNNDKENSAHAAGNPAQGNDFRRPTCSAFWAWKCGSNKISTVEEASQFKDVVRFFPAAARGHADQVL